MKVTKIEAIPFEIPYGKKLSWATGAADSADHVLVKIYTDEGITGISEAIPRPTIYGESQVSICYAIQYWFAPILIDQSPFSVNLFQKEMNKIYGNHTAKAALDMALFDIQSQFAKQPLFQFLGGDYPTGGIPLTWMAHLAEVKIMVQQVEDKYEQGYRSFKLKGGINHLQDMELVRVIRKELGKDVMLYLDANQGYSLTTAAYVVKVLSEYGVNIIEEPIAANKYVARRDFKLRYMSGFNEVNILGDDSTYTSSDVARELLDKTIDMVSVKTARTGVTESRKIMAIAEKFGAGVLIGTQGDSAIGTMLSAHIAAGLDILQFPAELSFFTMLPDDLLIHPPLVKGGSLFLPLSIGSGIVINEKAFAKYRKNL